MKEKIKEADALFHIERIPPLLPIEGRYTHWQLSPPQME
jgi:hypothetical protein